MTDKRMAFVEEYLKDPERNGTQAAIRAGYSAKTAGVTASQLLKQPKIQLAIQEKLELVKVENAARLAKEEEENWLDPINIARGFKDIYNRCMQAEPVMRYDAREKRMVPVRDEEGNAMYVFDSNGANRAWENIAKHVGFYELDNSQKQPIINIGITTNNIAIVNGDNHEEEAGNSNQLSAGNILTLLPPSTEE